LAEVKLIARGNLQLAECRCSAAASYFDRLVEPGVSEAAPLSDDVDFEPPEPALSAVEESRVDPLSFLFGFT
jgi:hypothetical protein